MKNRDRSPLAGGEARSGKEAGESGQGLAEYALVLALVALVCVAALGTLGGTIAASPGWAIP
ncbi:MAG: hypothetical protein HUU14_08795 [Dehalococcoidia bacterium]|nr:MAG: hypothetical protein EDM76_10045 [bacterium]MCE7927151.1 hypothetical protein [Chloroflexi bacterium CFX7]MCK6565508.1 hypothetical protein [Dehalococcoidia bacterium]MCL4230081.1 hypothetical protein [Dehalococcoidia bacterium]NUQ55966.1 hypothetical protein [Dehalococcoidia bacterium]